ncbi:hypothetical protein BFX40_28990 [Mesorhizobium sp. SEMIA 3007]|nr:hypothetical protein BFX40_28990 [Mesorhizobium sp. SEMIA 3007]
MQLTVSAPGIERLPQSCPALISAVAATNPLNGYVSFEPSLQKVDRLTRGVFGFLCDNLQFANIFAKAD